MSLLKKTLEAKKQAKTALVPVVAVTAEASKKRTIESALTSEEVKATQSPSKRVKKSESSEQDDKKEHEVKSPEQSPNIIVVHEDGEIELISVDPKKPVFSIKGKDEPIDIKDDSLEDISNRQLAARLDPNFLGGGYLELLCLDQNNYVGTDPEKTANILTKRKLVKNFENDEDGEDEKSDKEEDDSDDDDDSDEETEMRIFGPIFMFIGPSYKPLEIRFPDIVIERLREIISGLRFLEKNECKGNLSDDDDNYGANVISINTAFRETFHDESDSIRFASCLLVYEAKDDSAKDNSLEIALSFKQVLTDTLYDCAFHHKINQPAQVFGDFFYFLAQRRVSFSIEALRAYSIIAANEGNILKIPDLVFETLFHNLMTKAKSHSFSLTSHTFASQVVGMHVMPITVSDALKIPPIILY